MHAPSLFYLETPAWIHFFNFLDYIFYGSQNQVWQKKNLAVFSIFWVHSIDQLWVLVTLKLFWVALLSSYTLKKFYCENQFTAEFCWIMLRPPPAPFQTIFG